MSKYFNKKWINENFPIPCVFVIALVLTLILFPKESKNEYTYSVNTPWMYGLLTAPFNFNIMKSEAEIQLQKDSITNSTPDYFYYNSNVIDTIVGSISKKVNDLNIPSKDLNYLKSKLQTIYNTGVISGEYFSQSNKKGNKTIQLIKSNKVATSRDLGSFYTPKQAYELLINDAPMWIDIETLKKLDLNTDLEANIIYDQRMTTNVKDEALQYLSLYDGEVLSGQKIIDRGEIISPKTYNILNSYMDRLQDTDSNKYSLFWYMIGISLLVSSCLIILAVYLFTYRNEIYRELKSVAFVLLLMVLFVAIASFMASMKMHLQFYVIPFAMIPILIRTFMDSRTALIVHVLTVFICMFMLPVELIPAFLICQVFVGYVCILNLKRMVERSQLVYTSIFIFITYFINYSAYILFATGFFDIEIFKEQKDVYLYFFINVILVSFSYSCIYIFERLFGFISEVTMIELSNTNNKLLQELSEVAPGTFQHSMQVSNLVVSAANKIGANAILVRTAALYHDIGKLKNTIFFTENQPEGVNPHKYLSYHESAKIIIGHVEEGAKLARKHKIPKQIIDFIYTHHGKGLTGYFYTSYQNEHPDEEVDKTPFTYPGPNPFSKETAILMMADTVEAASRSLRENTKEAIAGLVNKLIDGQVKQGMFDNTQISFKDIADIKEVFIEKLVSMRHVRVAYPELKKKTEEENQTK